MSQFSASVNIWQNPGTSKTRGFATLFINVGPARVAIEGFTIVQGDKGLFVGWPQGKPYQKDGKTIYPKTTRVLEDRPEGSFSGPVQDQINNVILAAYGEALAGTGQSAAAGAQTQAPDSTGARPTVDATRPAGW